MDRSETLRVMYWNANSLRSKLFVLYDFLRTQNITIACISETFFQPDDIIHRDADYMIHRLDRSNQHDNHRSGGVAIIIKRNIRHNLLPAPRTRLIEALSIELIANNNNTIRFTATYLPGGATQTQINQHYKHDLRLLTTTSSYYYLCGDLNSKHRLWNCSRANRAGQILYHELNQRDFIILHPHEHTFYPSAVNNLPSTIDLTLSNAPYQTTELEAHPSCSDHCYVTFNILLNAPVSLSSTRLIPCYRLADWEKYRDHVSLELNVRPFPQPEQITETSQIDDLANFFTRSLLKAQDVAVPKTTPRRYSLVLPLQLQQLIAEKHRLVRRLQRNPGLRHIISPQLDHLTQVIDQRINNIRNDNFDQMLSRIPDNDQYRSLFQTAKFLRNRQQQLPPLKQDDITLITATEKASALALQFEENHRNPLELDNRSHSTFVDRTVNRFLRRCNPCRSSIELSTTAEVRQICRKLRNSKAPGDDRVHNTLIKQMPPHGFLYLTLIINACLLLGYFPKAWRHAVVMPIKKPQKPSTRPSSYRPISLLSTISKILERVIKQRLQKHLDVRNIIPPFQHGFRSRLSTATQLFNVTKKIRDGLDQRLSTGMVLIDIEKAFDRVWHNGLLFKMIKIGTPHYIIRIIASFLRDRTFSVKVNNITSSPVGIRFGVPQGAVLSPTLYNIFTYDVPTSTECEIAQFADDTAFLRSSRFVKNIVKRLQQLFKKYNRYYKQWKITVNSEKTQAIFFSRRRTRQLPQRPFLAGESNIEWSSVVKYLGVLLDRRLTFNQHCTYVAEKALKAVKLFYSLLNRRSSLSTRNKTAFYKLCIRPIMTYAAPIIITAAKSHKKRLQVVQNKTIRMITNAPWWTRTHELHEETSIDMIDEYLQRLNDNFHARHDVS